MSNNHEPLISVIIAVYNPGKYLRACLDSIVNQTYKNLEIILIDDGSTDDSLAVCKEYAEKDNRIIVHHKENSGVSATRNQGIRLAHGDYFSFIDSDDFLELDAYEYLVNIIKEHKVDAVNYEHFITYENDNSETTHVLPSENYGYMLKENALYQLVHNVQFAWNKLFSKHIIDNIWFDEEIFRGEDSLFSIQAFDKAHAVWFDTRPLYHYVQRDNSAVRGTFKTSQLSAVKLIDRHDPFFKEKHPSLYDAQMGRLLNLLITLFFDMSSDKTNHSHNMKMVVAEYKKLYKKVDISNVSKTLKMKLRLFRVSPKSMVFIHRFKLSLKR